MLHSTKYFTSFPAANSLLADEVLEFHAARIILLLKLCGHGNKITGLTKLAKLDFFVRYPAFFSRIAAVLSKDVPIRGTDVESSMVRYHYGPWDQRYYQVLAYLEAKSLITVTSSSSKAIVFRLTDQGKGIAAELQGDQAFSALVSTMTDVKKVLGSKTGSQLKALVYRIFTSEVAERKIGDVI